MDRFEYITIENVYWVRHDGSPVTESIGKKHTTKPIPETWDITICEQTDMVSLADRLNNGRSEPVWVDTEDGPPQLLFFA